MCTKVMVKDKAGNVVSLRTMEAAVNIEYGMKIIPRNFKREMSQNPKINTLGSYVTKYAALGAVDFKGLYGSKTAFHEAINEKGLSISGNAFRSVCKYSIKNTEDFVEGDFDGEELLNYIVSMFSTLDEVRNFFEVDYKNRIFIEPRIEFNTVHLFVSDKDGNSIVIESTDREFKVIDNPLNVMTNSPDFYAQTMNLTNYMHLSPYQAPNNNSFEYPDGMDIQNISSGTGANGLPGNSYSMSRFVRAAFFQRTAALDDNIDHTMRTMWGMANNFDIPFGSNREKVNPIHAKTAGEGNWIWSDKENNEVVDQAVFTMVQDHTNGIVQYKDWNNNSIREINMHDYDLDADHIYEVSVYEDNSIPAQKVILK